MNLDLMAQILEAVREIPEGAVATYGQIAVLTGHPRQARFVGQALKHSELLGDYPCHRVVNAKGQTAPGWPEQIRFLEAEGVSCENGVVDLKKYQWKT